MTPIDTRTGLIHGRFVSTETQLANVRRWNAERGWGLTEADFTSLGEAPTWPMDDPLGTVVLVPFLDTIQRTFEELWAVASGAQPNRWRWDELKSDLQHLWLLEGQTHTPGLRWVVVDLGAHWNQQAGVRPLDVRSSNSLHADGLAAAAHHPEWVRQMDRVKVPYVCLAGYQVSVRGDDPWRDTLILHWSRNVREVGLDPDWSDSRYLGCAIPVRREL